MLLAPVIVLLSWALLMAVVVLTGKFLVIEWIIRDGVHTPQKLALMAASGFVALTPAVLFVTSLICLALAVGGGLFGTNQSSSTVVVFLAGLVNFMAGIVFTLPRLGGGLYGKSMMYMLARAAPHYGAALESWKQQRIQWEDYILHKSGRDRWNAIENLLKAARQKETKPRARKSHRSLRSLLRLVGKRLSGFGRKNS